MDGLMFVTERLHWISLYDAARQMGIRIDDAFMVRTQGVNATEMRSLFVEAAGSVSAADELLSRKRLRFQSLLATCDDICKPGLLALLDALETWGLRRAVATGAGAAYCRRLLDRAGITKRFDAIVTGDVVRRAKPEPEIFELAARRLGYSPSECVVLEDSPNGIEAAYRAGCYSIMVPDMVTPGQREYDLANAVVPSLFDVIDLMDRDWW
nr:HAD family phosphatase [Collinsella sp. An2]